MATETTVSVRPYNQRYQSTPTGDVPEVQTVDPGVGVLIASSALPLAPSSTITFGPLAVGNYATLILDLNLTTLTGGTLTVAINRVDAAGNSWPIMTTGALAAASSGHQTITLGRGTGARSADVAVAFPNAAYSIASFGPTVTVTLAQSTTTAIAGSLSLVGCP